MSTRLNQLLSPRFRRAFLSMSHPVGQAGRLFLRGVSGGLYLRFVLLLLALFGLGATPAMALTFDYESGVSGWNAKTMTQTVSGESLKATSVNEILSRSLMDSMPPVAGYDSLIAGTSAGESSVTFSLNGGKTFDLTSISFMENGMYSEAITLTSNTGQTVTYNLALGSRGTFNVAGDAGAAKMQGITSFTVTANPGNFSISFDDIVINNIISPPSVSTNSVTNVTTSSATLNGSVNANGFSTNVSIDYGTSSSYGNSVTPTVGATVAANAGASATSVTLTGLACSTTYHFRINGVNAGGTTNGGDTSFTTSNCPGAYANANFDYESNVSGLSGMGGHGVTQTVSGEVLIASSATDVLIGSQAVPNYLGYAIPPISGTESLYAGASINGETTVSFLLGGSKPFDLKSITFKELVSTPETITFRSNKGSIDYYIDANATGILNLSAVAQWQGITGFTVTAAPSNFALAFDNIVLENIFSAAPTVASNTASSISGTGATLNGTVNGQTSNATVSFDYGTNTGYGSNVAATTNATAFAGIGNRASAVALTGLICNTTYHFRVKAVNAGGAAYGDDATFTTGACPITYAVTYNSNGGTGSVPTDSTAYSGGATVTVAGNSLTRTGYAFTGWNTAADGSGSAYPAGSGTFSISANTTLYAQWTATAPSATTNSATSITASGATLNGSVNSNGLTTSVSFDYGTTTGYGTNVAATIGGTVSAGAGSTAVAKSLSGLACNTTYHYRVSGVSTGGTSNGSDTTFTTSQCTQNISFNQPTTQTFGTTPTLSASADSGLTVSFSSSTTGVCTITSGGALTFITAGTCTIQASQSGSGSYAAATPVSQTFTVSAIVPGAPGIGAATVGDGQISVAFTAPVATGGAAITGYTATCTSSDGGVGGSNGSTVSPILVSGLSNGKIYSCSVKASNGLSGPASADSSTVIPKASQSITFGNPGPLNFGSTPTLTATSSSSATPTFTSTTTGVCSITSGGTLTFVAAGTCSINADLAGDGSHFAASTVSQSFAVAAVQPAAPAGVSASASDAEISVSFSAPASTGGKAISSYTATCTSGNGGTAGSNTGTVSPIVISGVSNNKTYSCTVTATNAGGLTSNMSAASNAVTPTPSPAVQSVVVPANGSYKAGANLDFSVTWDGAVTVTGSPQLALVIGATTVQATYQAALSTATISLFRYTVLAGQSDSDGIAVGALSLNGGSIQNAGGVNATLGLGNLDTNRVLVDTTAPTLPAANVMVNNQSDPHKVVLTFSETLASSSLGNAAAWGLAANDGSPVYSIASVALVGGSQVALTLAAVAPDVAATTISNSAANAHLKIVPPATLTDLAGNAYAAGSVTEAGGVLELDSTVPVLSSVASSTANSSGGTLTATASEKSKAYWLAVASGALAPTVAEVKAAVNYRAVSVVASGQGTLPAASAGSLTLSGLAASTSYDLYVVADDAAGNSTTTVATATLTTTAVPVAPPATPSPALPTSTNLPSGGSASPSAGQTLVVTDSGKSGGTINLPAPSSSASNSVNVSLPGTGTVAVSSTNTTTQLSVQSVLLPGSGTAVSTVAVNHGAATFSASQSGQVVAGLNNGIAVVAGSNTSRVTVDATGTAPLLGLSSSDTIVVPGGSRGVAGTAVSLPAPSGSTAGASVSIQIGGQTLTAQSGQANSVLTFKEVDIGGVSTPVLAVTGSAQITTSGGNQPIVSMGGSVLRTGSGSNAGASVQVSADSVYVTAGFIVLPSGSFSAADPVSRNVFAAIKDGVVWAGETADFDKNGNVSAAYLGSRDGSSSAVGDALVAGDGKFAAATYRNSAFVPRLSGSPLRLGGAKLDERLFVVINQSAGSSTQPTTPVQTSQGVLSFNMRSKSAEAPSGSSTGVNLLPTQRIRIDTSRVDGISVNADGAIEVVTSGLVTTLVPAVSDPQGFATQLAASFPTAVSVQRTNGSWQISTAEGTTFVLRPQWAVSAVTGGVSGFSATADGRLRYADSGAAQYLVPDFYDYPSLVATLRAALNDAKLSVQPLMDGTAQLVVNGSAYRLAPQWQLVNSPAASGKPAWWMEGGTIYIKNADGSAQGFTVRQ